MSRPWLKSSHVQNKKLSFSRGPLVCALLSFTASIRAETPTAQEKIFISQPSKPTCKVVSKGPQVKLESVNKSLHETLSKFVTAVKENQADALKPLFHRKTKVKKDIGERLLAPLRGRYRRPWDLTVFRVYALASPKGEKATIPCEEDDIALINIFGYELQFGAWVQLMGQNDLARLYVALAPTKGAYKIVGLHNQQWTFEAQDYQRWLQKGLEARSKNLSVLSHMRLDIAQKLLFGGNFITFNIKDKIIAERDRVLPKDAWTKMAADEFKDGELVYTGTIMPQEGLGILVRYRVPQYLSKDQIMANCMKTGKKALQLGWLAKGRGGIRCEYLLPREDVSKEGIMGSQYLTYTDLGS